MNFKNFTTISIKQKQYNVTKTMPHHSLYQLQHSTNVFDATIRSQVPLGHTQSQIQSTLQENAKIIEFGKRTVT